MKKSVKDHHFLAIAVLILIMSAIVYYSGGGISGYAVSEINQISVYQKDATTITIDVEPEEGVNRYATFLKGVSQVGSTKLCSSNRCVQPNTVEFYIPENWGDGSYSLRFYDYRTSSYQEVNFNIRRQK